jgi:hypothetical protein
VPITFAEGNWCAIMSESAFFQSVREFQWSSYRSQWPICRFRWRCLRHYVNHLGDLLWVHCKALPKALTRRGDVGDLGTLVVGVFVFKEFPYLAYLAQTRNGSVSTETVQRILRLTSSLGR